MNEQVLAKVNESGHKMYCQDIARIPSKGTLGLHFDM